MTLGDDIVAARGTPNDLAECITSMADGIEAAERFVLADDVTLACYQLMHSRPSSLLSAMPMCRMPYPRMWIEWNGGLSSQAGFARDATEQRPEPLRMGCLIETDGTKGGQRGSITWAWIHKAHGVYVCGLGVNFDWSPDADVASDARAAGVNNDSFSKILFNRWVSDEGRTIESVAAMMRTRPDWAKLASNPEQVRAVQGLLRHEAPWWSRHAAKMTSFVAAKAPPADFARLVEGWEGDIRGEAPFVSCFVMMLNSRNAVDHEQSEFGRLNRARARRGKGPLLSHTVTRLHLSAARQRAASAAGASRDVARQHLVMGHFKIRKSGVWWWSPFVRGDASRPMKRAAYTVTR